MNTITKPKPIVTTDVGTDTFYACAICQSQAPFHACVITPDRPGICGNYHWRVAKVTSQKDPYGPFKPITKGVLINAELGQWRGVNEYSNKISYSRVKNVNLYSLMKNPPTACLLAEAVTAVLPHCNGVMTVNREYPGVTPVGITFSGLMGTIRGGEQTPGFTGHAKKYITQENFLKAEGGLLRIVWMPVKLKEEIRERFTLKATELGIPDLLNKVADETIGVTEEAILPFLREKGHPALAMKPILDY
jgi:acetyl-CoA synthase